MGNNISIKNDFGLVFIGSLIFLVSFLWKDLLTDIEDYLFPKEKFGIIGRLIYIIIITIFILSTVIFLRNTLGLRQITSKYNSDPLESNDDNILDVPDIGID